MQMVTFSTYLLVGDHLWKLMSESYKDRVKTSFEHHSYNSGHMLKEAEEAMALVKLKPDHI